jgi:NADH:ubiquinone oxidoreductase subunit F (NADH-binding)
LTEVGAMMGSGGMIVMDDKTCVVDLAKYFLSFLVEESCGKCTPCREGLYQLHKLTIKISEGRGVIEDIDRMVKLSESVVLGSLCGLGKSGPNPLLSTIKYFREEFETHINDKKCPAGVCRDLIKFTIEDNCTGCTACVPVCGSNAITGKKKEVHVIDQKKCTQCNACYAVCTFDSITIS